MSMISQIENLLPVSSISIELRKPTGLVIIDEIVGFASVGGGNLAPQQFNAQVERMVRETDRLAKTFSAKGWPILAFRDCHRPGKAEPPYPPHCEQGSGEEEFVPELKWLKSDKNTRIIDKDCINGFVGAQQQDQNLFLNWIKDHGIEQIIVVGICTDICVMDFVLTLLSARNHGMTARLKDIYVYEKACATYDLPKEVALAANLPATAAHPQEITHHLGLYFMASRGALIAREINII